MLRRDFIKKAAASSVATGFVSLKLRADDTPKTAAAKKTKLPRRRGFNLMNMFLPVGNTFKGSGNYDLGPFHEQDFEIIAGWGFDFVRLPLSYWCWSSEDDWFRMDEKALKQIDQAVEWGKQYGIHVNINFHRAPGYCVNPDPVIKIRSNLFFDEAPLEAFCYQWGKFAERYKGRPSSELSFDLLNEPPGSPKFRDGYIKAVRAAIKAIRDMDSSRLICVDGYKWGREGICELDGIDNFFQSSRGYDPREITHFRAQWCPDLNDFPEKLLGWPMVYKGIKYDKNYLRAAYNKNWDGWEKLGGAVHCGEFGCYNKTPAPITYAWTRDILDVFKERNWGWALWRLRGAHGVLDSDRADAKFENFKGHQLDRDFLEILKQG